MEERERVVVGDERSIHMNDSGASPDIEVPHTDQLPSDTPILQKAVSDEEKRRRGEDEGTEADDESDVTSVHEPFSFIRCESEGVTFEEAIGRGGLFWRLTLL